MSKVGNDCCALGDITRWETYNSDRSNAFIPVDFIQAHESQHQRDYEESAQEAEAVQILYTAVADAGTVIKGVKDCSKVFDYAKALIDYNRDEYLVWVACHYEMKTNEDDYEQSTTNKVKKILDEYINELHRNLNFGERCYCTDYKEWEK